MKVAKYIADLLFEYECVVIPGLGGFITKNIPAKILPIQNHFTPPSKEIVFNAHLITNDGLLVNHLARQEKLTYIEAREAVERFVKKCLIELKNGKQIRFRKVGALFMDKEKNIQFEPDKTQNYFADSFGLKSFVSPEIKRTIQQPMIKRSREGASKVAAKSRDRKPKETYKREPKPVANGPKYIHINVSFILFVLAIAALVLFRPGLVKTYYNNYSSFIPVYSSSAPEYLSKNLDHSKMISVLTLVDKLNPLDTKNKKDSTKTVVNRKVKANIKDTGKPSTKKGKAEGEDADKPDNTQKEKDSTKFDKKTEIPVQKNIPEIASTKPDYKYFIMAGVFREKMNAEKLVLRLRAKGFNAMIVDQNNRGLYRVCFDAFVDINKANQQMAVIRKEEEVNTWLLSI